MRSIAPLVTLLRASYATAIFACAALVIDYQNLADPAFCGTESGCFKVRASDLGRQISDKVHGMFGGATLPQVAIFIFLAVFALTFFLRTRRAVQVAALFGGIGAVAASLFIVAQVQIGALCPYCMIVDVSSIVGGLTAIALAFVTRGPPGDASTKEQERHESAVETGLANLMAGDHLIAWGVTGAVLAVVPFVWSHYPDNPPLPGPIAALQQPGKTTIVSFTDFQCPYCRGLYPVLKTAEQQPNVVLHRYMAPLDGHPGAMPAAEAYVCAPEEKREALAEALYGTPAETLTPEGIVALAGTVGVTDATALRTCMLDPATKTKIEGERSLFFEKLGGQGLPTTWVNRVMVKGNKPEAVLKAMSGSETALPIWSMFLTAAIAVLGAVFVSMRAAPASEPLPEKAPEPLPAGKKASKKTPKKSSKKREAPSTAAASPLEDDSESASEEDDSRG